MSRAAAKSAVGNAAVTMTSRLVPAPRHAFSVVATTSKQCPAYLQAMQIQLLQHEPDHTITDIKCKLRGIHPGSFDQRYPK